jgi:hypothetical protein
VMPKIHSSIKTGVLPVVSVATQNVVKQSQILCYLSKRSK